MQKGNQNYPREPYRQPQAYNSLGQRYEINNNKASRDTQVLYRTSLDTGEEDYFPEPQLNRFG